MSTPRNRLVSLVLDRHFYAAGGMIMSENTTLSPVERDDAEEDSWSPVASINTARAFVSAAVGHGHDCRGCRRVGPVLFETITKAMRARRWALQ